MPIRLLLPCERAAEAERLIDLARALLDQPEEEIVINYLDHAIEALHIVFELGKDQTATELHA